MAIHINLLHEQKTQQKQAERDPLKLGMLGILIVAMLFGGYYTWKSAELGTVQAALADANADFDKLKPAIAQYEKDRVEYEVKIAVQSEVTKRIEDRFFWAPALEIITKTVPVKVQLTNLGGNASTEMVTLRIRGIIADVQPREAADKLRVALIEGMQRVYDGVAAEFTDLKERDGLIKFEEKEYPAAEFEILLKLNRRLTAPAAPATQP